MARTTCYIACVLRIAILAVVFGGNLSSESAEKKDAQDGVRGNEADGAVELIADPTFQLGFTTKDRYGKKQAINWNSSAKPEWKVAQHYSKSCLADSQHHAHTINGGFLFQDEYQSLEVHPADNAGDLILGVNAFKEFAGAYRQNGEPWPHLLVEQRISGPEGHLGESSPRLSEMQRLDLAIRVRLLYDRMHQDKQYDARLHAAQFSLYFTVQNLNRQSQGYGDYYWFGVGFYDSRKDVTALVAMQDKGSAKKQATDKFIYNVGIAPFTSEVVRKGNWVAVRGDLLPQIRAGLQEAWKQGYLTASKDLADYRIGELNLGWEITGLDDAAMAVKDFSTKATLISR
jgi:hypothetical protein